MSSSIKVIKEQNIIDLENIVVQFPSRDGSLFGRKKFTAVNNVSLGIKAGETIGLARARRCAQTAAPGRAGAVRCAAAARRPASRS